MAYPRLRYVRMTCIQNECPYSYDFHLAIDSTRLDSNQSSRALYRSDWSATNPILVGFESTRNEIKRNSSRTKELIDAITYKRINYWSLIDSNPISRWESRLRRGNGKKLRQINVILVIVRTDDVNLIGVLYRLLVDAVYVAVPVMFSGVSVCYCTCFRNAEIVGVIFIVRDRRCPRRLTNVVPRLHGIVTLRVLQHFWFAPGNNSVKGDEGHLKTEGPHRG